MRLLPAAADLSAVFASSDLPGFRAALQAQNRLNPIYDGLRRAYVEAPDSRLMANMNRTRALPAELGERHVVVNVAAGEVRLYERGEPVRDMKAVVGALDHPTPMIAARLRHTVLRPYWNIPEDLAQTRFAPLARRLGPQALAAADIQVLSDWTPDAEVVSADVVDWAAVETGRKSQRLRQAPGPGNMMGVAKFMLPNTMGIYLHDTPYKGDFKRERRAFSAGCVRIEDAEGFFQWLHGPRAESSLTAGPNRLWVWTILSPSTFSISPRSPPPPAFASRRTFTDGMGQPPPARRGGSGAAGGGKALRSGAMSLRLAPAYGPAPDPHRRR